MDNYPETVAKIANDYLDRVGVYLQRRLPAQQREEFLREMQSHVYEAYQHTPGDDEVTRILTVLRRLGEPADYVSEQLPGTIVRVGKRRNMPLYILTGVLIALFGLPLGFGGVGVVFGLLVALSGLVFAYYAIAGALLFTGFVLTLSAFIRLFDPDFWSKLTAAGVIHMDVLPNGMFEQAPRALQACLLMVMALLFLGAGAAMWRAGKYLLRGLKMLFHLATNWTRKGTRVIGRKLSMTPEIHPIRATESTV